MMNTEKIAEVLKGASGLVCDRLCTDRGARCVVAELLYAAGYTNGALRGLPDNLEVDASPSLRHWASREALQVLWDEYRMTDQDVADLIECNDALDFRCDRSGTAVDRLVGVIFAVEHWDDYIAAYGHCLP